MAQRLRTFLVRPRRRLSTMSLSVTPAESHWVVRALSILVGSMTISNGTSLELPAGPVLTIDSGASVTTAGAGKIILDTSASYINLSSSAPDAPGADQNLLEREGWRMLAAPDNVTVGSMFASPSSPKVLLARPMPLCNPTCCGGMRPAREPRCRRGDSPRQFRYR